MGYSNIDDDGDKMRCIHERNKKSDKKSKARIPQKAPWPVKERED